MTTIAINRHPPDLRWLMYLLILLAAGVGLYGVGTAHSHAIAKHGDDALEIRNCIDNNGAFQVWRNPVTRRLAEVCNLGDPETWGIRIVEQIKGEFQEITAFIENNDIAGLEEYLIRRGYGIIEQAGGLP